jgi:hypothetical protein
LRVSATQSVRTKKPRRRSAYLKLVLFLVRSEDGGLGGWRRVPGSQVLGG